MEMVKVDIEKYLEGSEEIERRRKVIPRILKSVIEMAQKHSAQFKEGQEIVRVSLKPYGDFVITVGDESYSIEGSAPGKINHRLNALVSFSEWTLTPHWLDPLPLDATLLLYAKLNEIVTAIDAAVPGAGIVALFNKIANVAEE